MTLLALKHAHAMSISQAMRLFASLLCLFGALASTGCSAQGHNEEAPPQEPRLVELFSWWTAPGEQQALQSLIDIHQEKFPESRMFNAAVTDGTRARKVLLERLASKDPPDFYQSNAHDMRDLVERNPAATQRLDGLFEELGLAEVIYPELLRNLSLDGATIAMPVNLHRENALLYNVALFRQVGLAPPKTIEELWVTCETFKEAGITPIATSSQGWINRIFFNAVAMGYMGPRTYSAFMAGRLSAEKANVRGAIESFKALLEQYTNSDAGSAGFGWQQAASAVFHGDAAMIFHGDWVKGYFQSLGWQPGKDFGAVGAPGAQDTFLYGIDVFALPVGAANTQSARDFFATVASKRAQEQFNQLKGSSSIRHDINPEHLDPVARATFNDLKNAKHRLLVQSSPAVNAAFDRFAKDLEVDPLYRALEKSTAPP